MDESQWRCAQDLGTFKTRHVARASSAAPSSQHREAPQVASCSGPHGSVACYATDHCVVKNAWPPGGDRGGPKACAPYARRRRGAAPVADAKAAAACAWTVYCENATADAALRKRLDGDARNWPRVVLSSGAPPSLRPKVAKGVHYLARRGDCDWLSPNPAHCVADPVNFHATLGLEATRRDAVEATRRDAVEATRRDADEENATVAYLGFGYGYGGLAAGARDAGWGTRRDAADAPLYLLRTAARHRTPRETKTVFHHFCSVGVLA